MTITVCAPQARAFVTRVRQKPAFARAVAFIERYSLKPKVCMMVGDLGSDKTFAERLGMRFVPASEFFRTGLA